MRTGSTLYWLLGDHICRKARQTFGCRKARQTFGGSTSRVANADGAPYTNGEQRYKPWGEKRYPTGASGLPTTYRFTGERQETGLVPSGGEGLYWVGSRWLDPALGRWIQPDTLIPEASQGVQAWDRYAYSNNNPINRLDPTGHWSFTIGYNLSTLTNSMLNLSGVSGKKAANTLDNIATAVDTAALAIDSAIAAGDIASAAIGATAGACSALPEGGTPAVVTGPAGALLGAGLFEISLEVRMGLTAANGLASISTGLTALSDLITGDTNDIRTLTLSESGFQYNHDTMVGRDTLTSATLSGLGWVSPIGVTSAPLQAAALLNDLELLYIGPLEDVPRSIPIRKQKINIDWE
jgi:RHS repeat-associated protein